MASITIHRTSENLQFAKVICDLNSGHIAYDRFEITIQAPVLKISREIFDRFISNISGKHKRDQAWQDLLLQKRGYYHELTSRCIILSDQPLAQEAAPVIALSTLPSPVELGYHHNTLGEWVSVWRSRTLRHLWLPGQCLPGWLPVITAKYHKVILR